MDDMRDTPSAWQIFEEASAAVPFWACPPWAMPGASVKGHPWWFQVGSDQTLIDLVAIASGKPTKKRWKITIFHGKNDGQSPFFMGKRWTITIFNGKTMENHYFQWENHGKSQFFMGKLWKIIIFNRKTMENHNFSWENYGKSLFSIGKPWKITIFNGKTMDNSLFQWPFSIAFCKFTRG